jgi:hypothetical protein
VPVNYHTLADVRTGHGEVLEGLLTNSVAALTAAGALQPKRVAQEGRRVRASAGAASFRRGGTLEEPLAMAEAQVMALKRELEEDPGAMRRRQAAARERAVRERAEQVERALKRLPELEAIEVQQGKKADTARASTTEAEATVRKMADGGYRPADNAQLTTDIATPVIVGVAGTDAGTDRGQVDPMVEPVRARHDHGPEEWRVDGGYPAHGQREQAAVKTTVYAPLPAPKDPKVDPPARQPGDSDAVAAWRERMGTPPAKAIYQERASTAECVHAQARERGLIRRRVRGQVKVRCFLLWHALAPNLMRTLALAPALLGLGVGAPARVEVNA